MVLSDPHPPHHPTVFCNRAFCALTGDGEPEVIGRDLKFLQGPRSDPHAIASLRRGIVRLDEVQAEIWNYRKDGSASWNVMTIGPVHAPGGRLLVLLGSLSDATARHDAEEMLARTRRLDTLGSMAAAIAHEFNNLMTVVMGSLEAVAAEPLTARQQDRLRRAQWATDAAGRPTLQMLGLARHRAAEAEAVDLGHAVRGVDRVLTQLARPGDPPRDGAGADQPGAQRRRRLPAGGADHGRHPPRRGRCGRTLGSATPAAACRRSWSPG